MKKRLLLFFFLCSLGFANAQTNVYHPFPNDSLVWLQERASGFGLFNFFIDEILGDTTIGTTAYKKMFRSNSWSTSPYTSSTPLYSPSLPVHYFGGWRQDIPGKKVYYVNPGSTTEEVLFDFDLSVGDTIVADASGDTMWVAAVDSALVGGVYHREFWFANTQCEINTICPASLIEGVGFSEGLRQKYYDNFSGWGQQLLCYSYQSTSIYPDAGLPCSLTLGISDLSDGKIAISLMPNPTSATVNLSINCTDSYAVEVLNSAGERLYSGKERLSSSMIDLSGYTPGIYLIRISDSKGNSATKKIVKQ